MLNYSPRFSGGILLVKTDDGRPGTGMRLVSRSSVIGGQNNIQADTGYDNTYLCVKIAIMPTVLITGGSGMIGKALTRELQAKGYLVMILSRRLPSPDRVAGNLRFAKWDIAKQTIDRDCIEQADYIVHLAGVNVGDKRWTRKRKKKILESRVRSGELLIKALKEIPNRVQAIISASAIGWYGPDLPGKSPRPFVEKDPSGEDFLGTTAKLWEASIDPVAALGKRVVKLRTGIVLSRAGGALPSFLRPIRLGIAAILGSGNQVISWIHIDDLCRIYIEAIENGSWNGVYNAVAPVPVSNKLFTIALAKEWKGRFFIPVHIPSFVLKWLLGEMSIEVLKSTTVSSEKAKQAGFIFQFPHIDGAVRELHHQF